MPDPTNEDLTLQIANLTARFEWLLADMKKNDLVNRVKHLEAMFGVTPTPPPE